MIDQKLKYTELLKNATLTNFPLPAKVLVTAIILVMGIAMLGALGQVTVHDIIPTLFKDTSNRMDHGQGMQRQAVESPPGDDLLGDLLEEQSMPASVPMHKSEDFIWLLRWSHIHLFGMNMIFIFLGTITLFLGYSLKTRAWLIGLPFLGVVVDILAMWLKVYVSPAFFWLHLPGGGLFGVIFGWVSLRALVEMWGPDKSKS